LDDGFPVLLAGEAVLVDDATHHRLNADTSSDNTSDFSSQPQALSSARPVSQFEGLAGWYDQVMRNPGDRGTLLDTAVAELVKLAGRGSGVALDVGCGTGIVASVFAGLGYQPIGVDLAADQLKLAAGRLPVVQGNAAELPFLSDAIPLAYSTFTSSAWEHQAASVKEVFRVLRPGGRYIDVGVHPCFNGGYADHQADGSVVQKPGYLQSGFRDLSNFKGTIRSRVGAWHRPLADVINAFLEAGFHIEKIVEGGQEALPSIIGISAIKP
jgi:SAM-dependent methyltransferase